MDIESERRFQALKRKLDALHYCQPLDISSAALAERLLADLLKTTEGFQALKKKQSSLENEIKKCHDSLVPLKKENQRLTRENNELHLEIMKTNEECESKQDKWDLTFNKLNNEREDLKFVIKQKDKSIFDLEKDCNQIRKRMDTYFQKNIIGSKSQKINEFGTQSGIEMSRPIKISELKSELEAEIKRDDRKLWAAELSSADERNNKLQERLLEESSRSRDLINDIKRLEKLISNRESEIKRLSNMQEGGQNLEQLRNNYKKEATELTIENLQKQLDFVNSENNRLNTDQLDLRKELQYQSRSQQEINRLSKNNRALEDTSSNLKRDLDRAQQHNLRLVQQSDAKIDYIPTSNLPNQSLKVQRENDELVILRQQINDYESEINQLKNKSAENDSIRSAWESDKRGYKNSLEILQNQLEVSKNSENLVNKLKTEIETNLNEKSTELIKYINENQQLKRELEIVKGSVDRISRESSNITGESSGLRFALNECEQDLQKEKNIKYKLEMQIDNQRLNIRNCETEIGSLKSENIKYKTENESIIASKSRLELLHESSCNEVKTLRNENEALVRMLEGHRNSNTNIDEQIKHLIRQVDAANETTRVVQKEHALISHELAQKINEIKICRDEKFLLEKELHQYQGFKSENIKLDEQTKIYQEKLDDTRKLCDNLKDEKRRLEGSLSEKERIIVELNNEKILINNKQNNIANEHKQYENELINVQETLLQAESREKSHLTQTTDLKRLKIAENDLSVENEKLKNMLSNLESQIKILTRENQHEILKRDELNRQVNDLTEKLGLTRNKYSNETTEQLKLQERYKGLEEKVNIQNNSADRIHSERMNLSEQISTKDRKIIQLESTISEKESQINQLKSLLIGMEKQQSELIIKIENSKNMINDKQSEVEDKDSEIIQFKKIIKQKEEEINAIKLSLMETDKDRDTIREEFDNKIELNDELSKKIMSLKQVNTEQNNKICDVNNFNEKLQTMLDDREKEINNLNNCIKDMELNINSLNNKQSNKLRETNEVNNDFNSVIEENQVINNELKKMLEVKNSLDNEVNKQKYQLTEESQKIRALELEKHELSDLQRKTCEENQRLKAGNSDINNEKENIYEKYRELEMSYLNIKEHYSNSEAIINHYINQINVLERSIEELSRELELSEKDKKILQNNQATIMQEQSQAKLQTESIDQQYNDTQRKLAQSESEKLFNDQKLNDLNIKFTHLKNLLSTERRRYSELEMVISQERETMLQKQLQQENLVSENATLKSELSRLNSKISGMGIQFESLMTKDKSERNISDDVQNLHKLIHEQEIQITKLVEVQSQERDDQNKIKLINFRLESDIKEQQNKLERCETTQLSGSIHLQDLQSGSNLTNTSINKNTDNNLREQIRSIREEYDNIMGKQSEEKDN